MSNSNSFVAIEIVGVEEINRKLQHWPIEAQDAAVDAVNEYMLNVVKTYPPYAHVTYKQAYGGWKSDKQRRYVMARINEGSITPGQPHRSQEFARNWQVYGKGRNSFIGNELPYGKYLVDDVEQARMPRLIGWKNLGTTIKERMAEIERRAKAAIDKVIKKLGLN